MGGLFTTPEKPRVRGVAMVGLPNAGKKEILTKMKVGVEVLVQKDNFFVQSINSINNVHFLIWSVWENMDPSLYRDYLSQISHLIYVIDSSNREQMSQVKTTLLQLLEELPDVKLFIFANKNDKSDLMNNDEIIELLQLNALHQFSQVQSISAWTGDGLLEGLKLIS